jgi:hypothetical protein
MKFFPTTSDGWFLPKLLVLDGAIVDIVAPYAWRHGADFLQGLSFGFMLMAVANLFVTAYFLVQTIRIISYPRYK